MSKRQTGIVHVGLLLACISIGGAENTQPEDVEIALRDGSLVRGQIDGVAAFKLNTDYGALDFPLNRLLRIEVGERLAPGEEKSLVDWIKTLDSDDFTRRSQAQQQLEAFGTRAEPVLLAAREKASSEAKSRIDVVLKKLGAIVEKPLTEDRVRSDEFTAVGKLEAVSFRLKTSVGALTVPIAELDSIRWMGRGGTGNVTLSANHLDEWTDTGIDALAGEPVAINASGTLHLFGNYDCGPDGRDGLGQFEFMVGAVVAKVGDDAPFLVGAGAVKPARTSARIYVKIFCPEQVKANYNGRSAGEFNVEIRTGAKVESTAAAKAPGEAGSNAGVQAPAQSRRRLIRRR